MQRSEEDEELSELEQRLNGANLPEHALKVAQKELKVYPTCHSPLLTMHVCMYVCMCVHSQRLRGLPSQFPEHAMARNYLETVVELPWSKATADHIDLAQAKLDLDKDHYALHNVKKRVLEFLAVRKLKNSLKGTYVCLFHLFVSFVCLFVCFCCAGPILCFVGAPGVGKTSVGRSVAQTMGRKFHRISLGGVSDQSDIRGHRRTYIGAMLGRIVQGLKVVGVNNPVFLLDEVDKLVSAAVCVFVQWR